MSKIFAVSHFRKAIPAGCDIRGYLRQWCPLRIARFDDEFTFPLDYRHINCATGFYFGQRGSVGVRLQPEQKFGYCFFFALQFDRYALCVVIDNPGQAK
jgi:hypothetical protein